jgi:hypothetical protein
MTIYFTIPDARPVWFTDVLRCAQMRSGLPVRVVDQVPERLQSLRDAIFKALSDQPEGWMPRFNGIGLFRWPVLLDAVKDLPAPDWPIVPLDWDILVCTDLKPWLARFAQHDYAITRDKHGMSAGPYLLRDIRPLRAFCSTLESIVENHSPIVAFTQDMDTWARVGQCYGWNIGDMSVPQDGQVFDHNLGESSGRFVMNGDHKKIAFENGHPYFFEEGGAKVEAVALHMWSSLKQRIPEFMTKLGL